MRRIMADKIGEIHITCYDDGTRVMDAGFYPSLEDMAHDVGDLISEQIPKVIPGDGSWKIANERRDCAHKLVQHFAEGMHVDAGAINWRDPAKELPKWSGTPILFALKSRMKTINKFEWVQKGYYSHDKKKFVVKTNPLIGSEDEYETDEVFCWMPMPYPISFEEGVNNDSL